MSVYSFSYPASRRYILHLDADAFFASCEQAVNPAYKGKPVITGKERGIVSAASYEAKKFGIKRGVPLWEVKKLCPEAIILPSDYEMYGIFSKRMFDIMRRFTPFVEEYSIDEAFADVTGFQRLLKMSYPEIAKTIKETVEKELGLSVSVGLSRTKVLTKVASKWDKPSGCTVILERSISEYLTKWPVEDVWGIGRATSGFLHAHGIRTSLQFIQRPWEWVSHYLSKPYQEIWRELRGESVYPICTDLKKVYKSISKTKTFTPPSSDCAFVFSQLMKNLENAMIKARRYNLVTSRLVVFLKRQDFRVAALEFDLNRPTCFPTEVASLLNTIFVQLFRPSVLYRATGVVLCNLQSDAAVQMSLFEKPLLFSKMEKLYDSLDQLAKRYGKHTVFLGSSLYANTQKAHLSARGDLPERKVKKLGRINERKFLGMPFLFSA